MLIGAVMLVYVFAQSFRGREGLVAAQREDCWRHQEEVRADVALEEADLLANETATRSAGVPRMVRAARRLQVVAERTAIEVKRAHLEPGEGGSIVCTVAYPSPSPWPW